MLAAISTLVDDTDDLEDLYPKEGTQLLSPIPRDVHQRPYYLQEPGTGKRDS